MAPATTAKESFRALFTLAAWDRKNMQLSCSLQHPKLQYLTDRVVNMAQQKLHRR